MSGQHNWAEMFRARAEASPAAIAIEYGQQRVSYSSLLGASLRVASQFRQEGGPPSAAFVVTPGPTLVSAMIGALLSGTVFATLDPTTPPDRLGQQLEEGGFSTVWCSTEHLPALRGIVGLTVRDIADLMAPSSTTHAATSVVADAAACIFFTSGSTGKPKAVQFTHRSLVTLATAMSGAFALDSTDRFLQLAAVGFDVLLEEVLPVLLVGATLVIPERPLLRAGDDLTKAIEDLRISGLELTTAFWHEWVGLLGGDYDRVSNSLRFVAVGGERLHRDLVETWRSSGIELIHVYGVTEAGCTSTTFVINRTTDLTTDSVPIGAPLPGTDVYIVVDGRPADKIGILGELFIAGEGLAIGYAGRAAATAERFVPNPFGSPGSRLYRTGDLALWNSGRQIEFVGRSDRQIKIHGYRIEADDVEVALRRCEGVTSAAVGLVEDETFGKRLQAWVMLDTKASVAPASIRRELAEFLPGYMIPANVAVVAEMPLSPNGKIDRTRLTTGSELKALTGEVARSAVNDRELDNLAEVQAVLAEVLGREVVGANEDFFDLGGHSLLAVRLVARLRSRLGLEVSVRDVFDNPTAAGLESVRRRSQERPVLKRLRHGEKSPMSTAQARLLFLRSVESAPTLYNTWINRRLIGPVVVSAIRDAITDVMDRHETLRTVFPPDDAGRLFQRVIPISDLTSVLSVLSPNGDELHDELAAVYEFVFNLETDPPIRAWLFRSGHNEHLLVILIHHVAIDGWSVEPLVSDLQKAYSARLVGAAPDFEPLPVNYRDYAEWEQSLNRAQADPSNAESRADQFWSRTLNGMNMLTQLPLDRERPAIASNVGAIVGASIDAQRFAQISRLARAHGASPFIVIHAAIAATLRAYGAGDDIAVGTPVSGRTDSALDGVVGFFSNTVVLRTIFGGDLTVSELIRHVRNVDLAAFEHEAFPFDRVVETMKPPRSLAHHPLIQILVSYDHGAEVLGDEAAATLVWEPFDSGPNHAKFDLEFSVREQAHSSERSAEIVIQYATDIFLPETVERILDRVTQLLKHFVESPDARIDDLIAESTTKAGRDASRRRTHETLSERLRQAGPVHGVDATEAIKHDFAAVLALDASSILPTDSFFELGGHSLLVGELVTRLTRSLGRSIGIRDVFRYPTVASLAAADAIVTSVEHHRDELATTLMLRNGTGRPIFLIHPGNGISWSYANLLPHLPDDRAVVALQAAGLTGELSHRLPLSVRQIAREYVGLIREFQPNGPYSLGGWSFGGTVAHEMAALMLADGELVSHLLLLDAFPGSNGSEDTGVASAVGEAARAVGLSPDGLGLHPDVSDLERLIDETFSAPGLPLPREFANIARVATNHAQLLRKHRSSMVECRAHLVIAADSVAHDLRTQWSALLYPRPSVCSVDSTHNTLMSPDAVAQYGESLRAFFLSGDDHGA